ncbi:hypothetical protein [Actinomadura sp. KC216]|nr:hypothetical protein [Actinomadura sp. KC216]
MGERPERNAALERWDWKLRIAWEAVKAGLWILWKLLRGGQDLP